MPKLGYTLTMVICGLVGIIVVSLVTIPALTLIYVATNDNGFYGLFFLLAGPVGWIVGCLGGSDLTQSNYVTPRFGSKQAVAIWVGGCLAAPFVGILCWIGMFIGYGMIYSLFHR